MPKIKIGGQIVCVELEASEVSIEALSKQGLTLFGEACRIYTSQFPGDAIGFGRRLPEHTGTTEP